MIIFKNFFSFALTFKAWDWLVINQTKATPLFTAIGTVQVVVCLLSIPMCECCSPFAGHVSWICTNYFDC
jgi:hypothetical protein